jgi:hypothetical protein
MTSTPNKSAEEAAEKAARENRAFDLELRSHLDAHAQFGPFETLDTYKWFFLRGMDIQSAHEKEKSKGLVEALLRLQVRVDEIGYEYNQKACSEIILNVLKKYNKGG